MRSLAPIEVADAARPFVTIDALDVLHAEYGGDMSATRRTKRATRTKRTSRPSRTTRTTRTRRRATRRRSEELRPLLAGGDRRSIADTERARAIILADPERVGELASLARDPDWLVSMRALDLLEKLAHTNADWVQPFKALFIGPLADSDKWEIRLQVVRALPLLAWTPDERERVIAILRRDVDHPQKFVRAWALDGLAALAGDDANLRRLAFEYVEQFEGSGSKALATRARNVRERLSLKSIEPAK
jgi:hypothetical protein